jgi:integrase
MRSWRSPKKGSCASATEVIAEGRARGAALGLYLWLVMVTGVRRGELYGLQIRDVDLDRALVHIAFNYVVRGGRRVRKDTKTHQDRWLAIDPDTCTLIVNYLDEIRAELAAVGVELRDDATCSPTTRPTPGRGPGLGHPQGRRAADAAGVKLDIKGGRHYTASQLLAGGFDLRNTAARLGHSGGGATTLRHYADPVPEVDRPGYSAHEHLPGVSAAGAFGVWRSSLPCRIASTPSYALFIMSLNLLVAPTSSGRSASRRTRARSTYTSTSSVARAPIVSAR